MLVCVTGGRDYRLTDEDRLVLDGVLAYVQGLGQTFELVSGCARGADLDSMAWADGLGLRVHRFPADWTTHGIAAGPLRNSAMVQYLAGNPPAMVVAYPGESGTADMIKKSQGAGLRVYSGQALGGWTCDCTNFPRRAWCVRCARMATPKLVLLKTGTGSLL